LKILSKIFWRLVVPFVFAFILAIAWMLEFTGHTQSGFFRTGGSIVDPLPYHIGLYASAALFLGCLVVGLWNTLRWGKEAEEYEADLKEADEIEKERRRKSSWMER
jgi:hypothetical protein